MIEFEMIRLAQSGDEAAEETLLEQYKPLVRSLVREYFLVGGEQDDLLQEGMLGLFKAIRHFDPGQEVSFASYARLLITRQIYHAIEQSQRQKHQALNQSIPMEDLETQRSDGSMGVVESPETIVLDLENTRELLDAIHALLSPLEREVLALYLQGYDYLQIGEKLDRSAKSIDNALQRIRGKIAKRIR